MKYELLFHIQEKEKNCIRLGLLLYYKEMLDYLLANQFTLLDIINNTKAIIYRVI